ncbi:AGE family epimerase/isomerase [Pseudomonas sp. CFBP 8770]|uniref:AGE family epimerase/isomerase n=1 Tax=unclassified Pseudomonas TaxID=196821 RepID=UPI00177DB5E0|nr:MULTISPECIES: AGE family epimerase/isomerase [unclassified Pseudomonas]MBD8474033.1 AGE family epimerase/isomerase [Pseudomonas sp. CFBP 8773]MBD8647162.1 AGE family epimerase/isomerase [Pseudomonas sp. CFBP 8770]
MPDPTLHAALAATQAHFREIVLPLWQGAGFDSELGLPFEAVSAAGQPLPAQRYRAMACARQLYVFSSLIEQPGAREHAATLFRSLQRHFHDAEHGGWFYSIDAQGRPLDRRKDLYTHAFIVFACAHYWAKVREPLVESVLNAALEVIATRFSTDDGLYEAVLGEDWANLGSGPLQNPLMHLAEGFLATLAVRDDQPTQAALQALCDAMQARFVEPEHGIMLEKPRGAVDNWFEPGHQFEWLFLVQTSPLLQGSALHLSLQRAFGYAQRTGVRDGVVMSMLTLDGQVLDATQRIWAQAEYLRALTLQPGAAVTAQLQVLRGRFLHPGGWHECRDGTGMVSRTDMPSTTPYHLLTCYQGLQAFI